MPGHTVTRAGLEFPAGLIGGRASLLDLGHLW
nr:MAG TPA: hypothetical protein [Caudoviricetes sp.]